jgi:tetratricopeptide (TPR) repeat protein
MKTLIVVASAACLFGLSEAASAQQSQTTLGYTPGQQCAAASASGINGKAADSVSVASCTQAIDARGSTQSEQAAAYLNRGVLHATRNEYAAAVADYDSALAIQSTLVEALIDRGCALAAENHPIDAAADFTKALALGPQRPETVYFDRALAREDAGDLKGAYLDYRKAAELDPNWDKPKHELARFTVARPGQS